MVILLCNFLYSEAKELDLGHIKSFNFSIHINMLLIFSQKNYYFLFSPESSSSCTAVNIKQRANTKSKNGQRQ